MGKAPGVDRKTKEILWGVEDVAAKSMQKTCVHGKVGGCQMTEQKQRQFLCTKEEAVKL